MAEAEIKKKKILDVNYHKKLYFGKGNKGWGNIVKR